MKHVLDLSQLPDTWGGEFFYYIIEMVQPMIECFQLNSTQ